jgi:hypothetical protein
VFFGFDCLTPAKEDLAQAAVGVGGSRIDSHRLA